MMRGKGRIKIIADKDTEAARWDKCTKCPNLMKMKLCKVCGCIMPAKVKLKHAKCPIGEW